MADILLRYWLPWYDSVLPSPPSYISESLKKTKLSLSEKREGECNSPHVVGDRGDWLMEGAELETGAETLSSTPRFLMIRTYYTWGEIS